MIHNIILKHLCNNIKTTLLLSRLILIPDNIMREQLYNKEEKTSLLELVYNVERNHSISKLSFHEMYPSIKKVLDRQWTLITLDDMYVLNEEDINAYTMYKGVNTLNKFEVDAPYIRNKHYNAKITIVDTRYDISHITVILYGNEFDVCYNDNYEFKDNYSTTEDGSVKN